MLFYQRVAICTILVKLTVGGKEPSVLTIRPIKDHSFFEQVGTAYVAKGKLKVQNCLDGLELSIDQARLKSTPAMFQGIGMDLSVCKVLKTTLEVKGKKVLARIRAIENLAKENKVKRELIGRFFNFVFGVNDEVYADMEDLHQDQSKLRENQHVLI